MMLRTCCPSQRCAHGLFAEEWLWGTMGDKCAPKTKLFQCVLMTPR
jgi:hypothetical protein